ncbi:MAG: hypothetical protein NTZ26_08940 [Candidatus Aminicenantes bacterium]|nr:hypothetical protein [Candidatus Aminicenantes bacterium]
MTCREALRRTRALSMPPHPLPVEETAARELQALAEGAVLRSEPARRGRPVRPEERDTRAVRLESQGTRYSTAWDGKARPARGVFHVAVADAAWRRRMAAEKVVPPKGREWFCLTLEADGAGALIASSPAFLVTGALHLVEDLAGEDISRVRCRLVPITFGIEKSTFDIVLTQYGRIIRPFDRDRYMREYARLGFSQVEVNGLATPHPWEQGPPDEFYPDFYTYCPALDQFTSSRLNRGFYPQEYLDANLARLKENVKRAVKYGLTPGLLCFEPRSMPEEFFRKYPTLRGPRVDHPFRSFKPRFALTLAHPAARAHYAELITNLLREAPELAFMAVWSNDSGSGFEHTKSLYVGRNGGPYLVREWKDDEEIARLAAENVARYYCVLRDAAAAVHPGFRIITRLESFYGERKHLWPLLRDGIDVEVNSLQTTGWENNYAHPVHKDIQVLGSLYHNTLSAKEGETAAELGRRGSRAYFYHYFAAFGNFEPLLGIPFPWLTHEKLQAAAERKAPGLAQMGGLHPPDKAPYAVNQDVFRAFQLDPKQGIDAAVRGIAERYAGAKRAGRLVRGWKLVDTAVRMAVPLPLYAGFGTVWNRLLVRPFVPDMEAIPELERAYYEKIMVSSIHNPNKVDLAKDVLFELVPTPYAVKAVKRMDRGVWKPLDQAIAVFMAALSAARADGDAKGTTVFRDQWVRARALRAWFETQRNAAAWIACVHGWTETRSLARRKVLRARLDEAIGREIRNAEAMIALWAEAGVEWMMVAEVGETPFIHGENFPDLLAKKIALMRRHRRDEPRIDPDYMFRLPDGPNFKAS